MIKLRYWLLAILCAMSIHVFAFGMYTLQYQPQLQSVPPMTAGGIEIDISMLDATAMDNQQATATPEPMGNIEEKVAVTEVQGKSNEPVEVARQPNEVETVKPLQQTEIKKPVNTAQYLENANTSDMFAATAEPTQKSAASPEKPLENTQTGNRGEAFESSSLANQANSVLKQAAHQTYVNLLARKLAEKKHYPSISRRRGEQGVVQLFFVVSRDGKVSQYRIDASSGFQRLDQAVMEMLENAQPLPAFPDVMSQQQLEVKVPITFELSG